MNIQKAIKESLRTKKMIARKSVTYLVIMPTNDVFNRMMLHDIRSRRLPGRGWQPDANDLIADDWYVTDVNFSTE